MEIIMANYSKLLSIAAEFFSELNSEMPAGIPQGQRRPASGVRSISSKAAANAKEGYVRPVTKSSKPAKTPEGIHSEDHFRGSIYDDRPANDQYGAKPMPGSPDETLSATEQEYCERCIDERDLPHPAITLDLSNLRNAIILSEILSPPLSKRFPRHR